MSHLLSDHPDWPNAMTTPTPRSNREWRELAEQAQRDLAAAKEICWKLRGAVLEMLARGGDAPGAREAADTALAFLSKEAK